jgi:cell division septation protein DedD
MKKKAFLFVVLVAVSLLVFVFWTSLRSKPVDIPAPAPAVDTLAQSNEKPEEEDEEEKEIKHTIVGNVNGTGKKSAELLHDNIIVARTEADEDGNYAFMNMPPGIYRVRAKVKNDEFYSESLVLDEKSSSLMRVPSLGTAPPKPAPAPVAVAPAAPVAAPAAPPVYAATFYDGVEMPSEKGAYTIQIKLYNSFSAANEAVSELSKNGIRAYVAKVESPAGIEGVKYRVRVGNFTSRQSASAYATEVLSKAGYEDWWIDRKSQDNVGKPPAVSTGSDNF